MGLLLGVDLMDAPEFVSLSGSPDMGSVLECTPCDDWIGEQPINIGPLTYTVTRRWHSVSCVIEHSSINGTISHDWVVKRAFSRKSKKAYKKGVK